MQKGYRRNASQAPTTKTGVTGIQQRGRGPFRRRVRVVAPSLTRPPTVSPISPHVPTLPPVFYRSPTVPPFFPPVFAHFPEADRGPGDSGFGFRRPVALGSGPPRVLWLSVLLVRCKRRLPLRDFPLSILSLRFFVFFRFSLSADLSARRPGSSQSRTTAQMSSASSEPRFDLHLQCRVCGGIPVVGDLLHSAHIAFQRLTAFGSIESRLFIFAASWNFWS